ILNLVPKTVGAACLVEAGAGPNAARERLVEKPAVQKQIQGPIRRTDMHGTERVIPLFDDFGEHRIEIGLAVFGDERSWVGLRGSLSEEKDDLRDVVSGQPHLSLQRRARIKA